MSNTSESSGVLSQTVLDTTNNYHFSTKIGETINIRHIRLNTVDLLPAIEISADLCNTNMVLKLLLPKTKPTNKRYNVHGAYVQCNNVKLAGLATKPAINCVDLRNTVSLDNVACTSHHYAKCILVAYDYEGFT